ncbi:MAG: DUF3029 family protein [Clostridia bacterium]|nr:DUF3029 family protein [Clostridia bacterium]
MKKFCDGNIERFIRNEYYDLLAPLSPTERFAKKFDLMLSLLRPELRENDEFFGWLIFDEKCEIDRLFPDEELPEALQKAEEKMLSFGTRSKVDRGHTLINYEKILKFGLSHYEKEIERELAITPNDPMLLAMQSTLSSVRSLIQRTLSFLDEQIALTEPQEKPKKLQTIKHSLATVPFSPARDFRDALQSIWIIHFLTPLAENAWYSISLGRFDQYVYPYYQASLANGMTRAEAKKMLRQFYELLNSYADGACLLNIGGEEYNELSELIVECQKEFSLPGPILAARITEHTPDRIWEMLVDEKLFSMGQPTFYGEDACVRALMEKGVPEDKAKQFANSSCMGIGLAGEEFDSMWGCVFSVSAALETALNGGAFVTRELPWRIPNIREKITTLDELYEAFEASATYLLDFALPTYLSLAKHSEETTPDCFVSLLTENCIKERRDRISGAPYHNVTVECMGMVNVSDGICAMDQLVFREKKYTLSEIHSALKNNFDGSEDLRQELLACPKFGQDSVADEYAIRVAEILQKIIRRHSEGRVHFCPSLHTLKSNIRYGSEWGAGYDGRSAGTPLAKNGGSSNFARSVRPTSLVLSASKLPQHKFFGGQPIDVSFSADTVREHKKELAALISTYLQRGGLQFQVNAASSKTLRAAYENPEQYSHLIVRVGGFSLYFNTLPDNAKLEFIERFEKEGT